MNYRKTRLFLLFFLPTLLAFPVPGILADAGKLKIEITSPEPGLLLTNMEDAVEVTGGASVFGGTKHLDLTLVIDSSRSLNKTDPEDFRKIGALSLVRDLAKKSDVQFGVVEFDTEAELKSPLTTDREAAIAALEGLDRLGGTNIAAGIVVALDDLALSARPDSTRAILLFTDGKSSDRPALKAAARAQSEGVVIHCLLLGKDGGGEELLRGIADTTGGAFVIVEDPSKLPEAFMNLRTTGVESVTLSVNGDGPYETELSGANFSGTVPLKLGNNPITATATSLDGQTATANTHVLVSSFVEAKIAFPADGTVLKSKTAETDVNIEASMFEILTDALLLKYPTRGIDTVTLSVNGQGAFTTSFFKDAFLGHVPLEIGENIILATATTLDGRSASDSVTVTVQPPGCGEFRLSVLREGKPAISISDRAVELIFDASGSMWGQIDGVAKITTAKETLNAALGWLPEDLFLSLRVYGHQYDRKLKNCSDSELLVPLGKGNREAIRSAIAKFQPKGHTPIAYSLEQVSEDFGDFQGERSVVLLTDGIESCDGDPAAAAQQLQFGVSPIPVHVIGFGMSKSSEEDLAGLKAISEISNGKFFTADDSVTLTDSLAKTAGTPYTVWDTGFEEAAIAGRGTFGVDEPLILPSGEYLLQIDSVPPREFPFVMKGEEKLMLVIVRDSDLVLREEVRSPFGYVLCE